MIPKLTFSTAAQDEFSKTSSKLMNRLRREIASGGRVGLLRMDDPRAKFAQIQFNGKDVTLGFRAPHGKGQRKGVKDPIVAAHDGEGWIAVLSKRTHEIVEHHGVVDITFKPSTQTAGRRGSRR